MPEWPPRNPLMSIFNAFHAVGKGSARPARWTMTSAPPAQPRQKSPHVSLSRFNRIFPERTFFSSLLAPPIPSSSSTVRRASRGPWTSVLSSKAASIRATPIPSSAPRVVSSARTRLSRTTGFIGSFEKSCSIPSFFWQTISRCACKMTPGAFSYPALAGFLMMRFPPLSIQFSSP